jgi:short-chain fatty acids transporter
MKAITRWLVNLVSRYLPDDYILALGMTLLVFCAALIWTPSSALTLVDYWGRGLVSLYGFTVQIILILVTGHVLANTRFVKGILTKISSLPKSPAQAVMFTAAVCYVLNFLNWGLGMIGGAILARKVAVNNRRTHYPILVAAVYGATLGRGFSASIALVVATPGHFLEKVMGVIPVSQTLFSPLNWFINIGVMILLVLVMRYMMPPDDEAIGISDKLVKEDEKIEVEPENLTPADRFNNISFPSYVIGFAGLIYVGNYFMKVKSFDININIVIIFFLALGFLLHGNPMRYKNAFYSGAKSVGSILLQFPIYAGIMGMMQYSGLTNVVSQLFINWSTPHSFPLMTFLSSGVVNMAIPSGGGIWAVQGPVMMKAAETIGADMGKTLIAFIWGEAWTNQIQPFWALPILAVAGLGIRDIMGYCAGFTIVTGIFIGIVLVFVG